MLVNVPFWGFVSHHITKPLYLEMISPESSRVMFHWDIYQPLLNLMSFQVEHQPPALPQAAESTALWEASTKAAEASLRHGLHKIQEFY